MTEKKYFNISMRKQDGEAILDMAREAGVPQHAIMQALVEMCLVAAGNTWEAGLVDEQAKVSTIELFVLRTMLGLGLLAEDEFQRAIALATAMEGKRLDLRLRGLAQLANERIDQLRPVWEAARNERKAHRPKGVVWDAKAAAAAAQAMLEADLQAERAIDQHAAKTVGIAIVGPNAAKDAGAS